MHIRYKLNLASDTIFVISVRKEIYESIKKSKRSALKKNPHRNFAASDGKLPLS